MNIKLEILFLILGGFLRIASTATSIWYLLSQNFYPPYLYKLYKLFIVLPSLVFFILSAVFCLINLCNRQYTKLKFNLIGGLVAALGGPLGVPLFLFAIILGVSKSYRGDFYIIESLTRSTTLVQVLFDSLPEILIQIFNNQNNRGWNFYTWGSIGITSAGAIYSSVKLCHALDKVQHFEQASQNITPKKKDSAKVQSQIVVTAHENEESNKNNNDVDVYDYSY